MTIILWGALGTIMQTRIRLIKLAARMLLTSNAFAFLWLTFFYIPPGPRPGSNTENLDLFYHRSRVLSQQPPPLLQPSPELREKLHDDQCMKKFVLFGIREHWWVFCKYPKFSRYRHLIEFPRYVTCPETNCSVILNHTMDARDLRGYDVVLFTNVYPWLSPEEWGWAHGNRTAEQRWVMISEESPLYGPGVEPPKKYGNTTYDWFDSYKAGSDFFHPYGYYEPYGDVRPPMEDLTRFLQPKKPLPGRVDNHGLVAWMCSHCQTLQWNRTDFVSDLGKILNVDKFGKCGKREISWNNDQKMFDELGKYKFYLSLENSCCDHYITEKFWRTLKMGIVPIVVGAPLEHYVKMAPPNSFIHADQFESLAELAAHILELEEDDSKYLKYFEWRREGKLVSYAQVEHYIRPLTNLTQCDVMRKLLTTDPADDSKLDYFGDSWVGSCRQCSTKYWMDKYTYPKNYIRENKNIWA